MTAADYVALVKAQLKESWLPHIYRERILKTRTRSYHFAELKKNAPVEIQHTLLGVELKVGNRRLLCPDLATARYLSVFARAGCPDVALPYDITKISQFADELESSWQRMLLWADHYASNRSQTLKTRIRGLVIATLRGEISEAGPGTAAQEFKEGTNQRS